MNRSTLSTVLAAGFFALLTAMAGCERQSAGLALPPGDAERGRVAFTELGCQACHRVQGVAERLDSGAHPTIDVVLGGQVTRVKTYGDLVTSIINPSHRLSRGLNAATVNEDGTSKMPSYNEVMTVQQMVDLTTFLSGTYSVWVPQYQPYVYGY